MAYRIGFDVGSTTIKAVVLNEEGEICYKSYERHLAQVRQKALEKIVELRRFTEEPFTFAFSGSGAIGLSEEGGLPFVQEVFASAAAVRKYYPETDVAGYLDFGLTAYRNFHLGSGALSLRFDLKNIFDAQYDIVRLYPMPGRSYQFSINYKF